MSLLQEIRKGREKYGLRRYLKRRMRGTIDRWFFSVSKDDLTESFRALGVREGTTLCVHSSLSRLGHVDGGADTVIDALQSVVGRNGRVLMPTFSIEGAMADHVDSGALFDVRHTPSRVGLITECFRSRDDVVRSCHPTNSVAGWGNDVEEIISGHDKSITPFGDETPYGRLATRDDAYILILDTHLHSILHHLQERVNFPNLFLEKQATVPFVDAEGTSREMVTKVMRPRIPYFVAIPPKSGAKPDWAILHDYALMFPSRREGAVRDMGYRFDGFPAIARRRVEFESSGVLKSMKLGRGEVGLLHVASFLRCIQPEMEALIDRYSSYYDPEAIAAMNLSYS